METSWERFKTNFCHIPGPGLSLDLSKAIISPRVREQMEPSLHKALEEMALLEGGALANGDEGRMVGHYWLRRPDLAPTPEIKDAILAMHRQVREVAQGVREGRLRPPRAPRFTSIIVIGIGGSALGPRLVEHALADPQAPLTTLFLDNTDPDGIDRALLRLQDHLDSALVIVISKSGGTKETRNGLKEVAVALEARGLALGPQAMAITMEGSALHRQALDQAFLEILPMWDWVGGRTSELSAVGLLPAALQGIDIEGLLQGAREMDQATRGRDINANPAALLAGAWYSLGRGRGDRDMVVIPYKDRLALLSHYLQQLVMESLGKEQDREGKVIHQGMTVYGNKGSTDQHAYIQQLRDGPDNFFLTLVDVLRDREGPSVEVEEGITSGDYLTGFLLGTRQALWDRGRSSITITLPEVSARTVGALLALFERAVGLYASLINVNAYHQPGVEAGKRAAAEVLDVQRRVLSFLSQSPGKAHEALEVARALEVKEADWIFTLLEHMASSEHHPVERVPGKHPLASAYLVGDK